MFISGYPNVNQKRWIGGSGRPSRCFGKKNGDLKADTGGFLPGLPCLPQRIGGKLASTRWSGSMQNFQQQTP